jgi:Recombination endonuclease VII
MKQRVLLDGVNGDARPRPSTVARINQIEYGRAYEKTAKGKERRKRHDAKRQYGISLHEYRTLRALASHCPICGVEFCADDAPGRNRGDSKVLDHNHTTGVIRGIICNTCNRCLGYMKDNADAILKLAEWAKR